MKITDRMTGDHKTFRKMMTELDAMATAPGETINRQRLMRLVELFVDHLMIHSWGEETFYYPAVCKAVKYGPGGLITTDYIGRLDQEHKTIDGLIVQLEKQIKKDPNTTAWTQTYGVFCRSLIAHMKKEEEELFPLSETLLGKERLEALSLELERHRQEAPRARIHLT